MAEKRKLEFFLLRYVPDAVKGEFVNVGLIMYEPGANGTGFADVRFTRDWRRLRCLDPQADIGLLAALEEDIRNQLSEVRNREAFIRRVEDSFSNVIQLSGIKACFSDNPAEELKMLTRMYLKRRVAVAREELPPKPELEYYGGTGRHYILGVMEDAFRRAGVWKLLMHGVPVSAYGHPRDPFKFDFGYRVGDEIKLFHAVSMKAGVDSAVLLGSRYQKIRPVMVEKTETSPVLTAVVEAGMDRNKNEIAFAVEMMEESGIRVAETEEMEGMAEVARRELRT